MIKSEFVRNILDLLVDKQKDELYLRKQLELLTDEEYTYTGAGLIVTFQHLPTIEKYRIEFSEILNGVRIDAPELEMGAQSNLFFENGIILYLELFSNSGTYPKHSLTKYQLSQEWLPNGGSKVIV